jgi:hypothetical protein
MRKMTYIQPQPPLVQYKQQVNRLLSMHNYTPLVISENDKNKQLTLFSQSQQSHEQKPADNYAKLRGCHNNKKLISVRLKIQSVTLFNINQNCSN